MDAIEAGRAKALLNVDPDLVDAGKRAHDKIMLNWIMKDWDAIKNKWVAVRLSDGQCDANYYDTKLDAVKHQLHEEACAYLCLRNIGPGGTDPAEIAIVLQFQRDAYAAGYRMPDPDAKGGPKDLLMTAAQSDYYRSRTGRHYLR